MRLEPQRRWWRWARAVLVAAGGSAHGLGCSAASTPTSIVPSGVVPARLSVTAPSGAEVRVDGILVGSAPFAEPISADPGPHQVVVVLDGHEPREERVVLVRGKTRALAVELDSTTQRKAAWALIGIGSNGVVAGIVLGALAVVEQRKASDVVGFMEAPDGEDFTVYNDAIAARDRYRIASGVAAGAGLGLFVTGALLYAFDAATPPKAPSAERRPEVSVVPLMGPNGAGASTYLELQW